MFSNPRRRVPVRILIATLVVLCMAVMALLLLGLGWTATQERLVQNAAQAAIADARLLEERLQRLLQPTRTALRQISFDSLVEATSLPDRLERIYVLSEELRANPLLSALYIGYADGDFLLARPLPAEGPLRRELDAPAGAAFLVQSITRGAGHFHFLRADGSLLAERAEPEYRFEARERPWYQLAQQQAAGQQALSQPYRFFTTQELGITLSQRSRQGQATVGLDLVLQDLSNTLAELRSSPGALLALVDARQQLLAFSDPVRLLQRRNGEPQLVHLETLGEPALLALHKAAPPWREPLRLEAGARDWVSTRLPLSLGQGMELQLLQATPMDELVAASRQRAQRVTLLALGLALLLLPLGWVAGGSIGRRLQRLRDHTRRLSRFDFSVTQLRGSRLREVHELTRVLEQMGTTIEAFLRLSERMATEPEVEQMLAQVLEQLLRATHCSSAAVFLWDAHLQRMVRSAEAGDRRQELPEQFAYANQRAARQLAREHGPQLRHLDLELRTRSGALQGLLVLEFERSARHEDPAFLDFARRLSGMLAVAIETRQLIESQRRLFDAVIQLMADAIDAKSPYTGGHCERVPQMAIALIDRLQAETEGPYAGFKLSESERYAFRLAAWLHDAGKVTSPEHIVDKASKLELIHNRIHEVRTRFEVLWRDAEIAHLRGEISAEQMSARRAQLQQDFGFVAQSNIGGEFLSDEAIARLRQIGAQTWTRHFDMRLGLAPDEARRLAEVPPPPVQEPLLADKPEHILPWGDKRPPVQRDDAGNTHGFDMQLPAQQQHQGELHNLSVRRGTLTEEDRFRINDHIVQTALMLKRLPWPVELARVPLLATTHHERLDGKGYPRRLGADQLDLQDRVLALADVFEALTAADRPYKPAKTLTETLRIMAFMGKEGHLDPELLRYFLKSRLWANFAEIFMKPEQHDAVDIEAIEALLPKA